MQVMNTTKQVERNARRYRRLQVLGCAVYGHKNLENGTVSRFANLDEIVDEDLSRVPYRGEVESTNDAEERVRDAAADLLAALLHLVSETPFMSDDSSCECGEYGNGFDDEGKPCEHIQAWRAIAKARGK